MARQSGQALVQILVVVAIMGVLLGSFASMMTMQTRESRALAEKLAAMDLQKLLTASLADGSVCQYVLNNPAVLTFDSTQPLPQTIALTNPTAATAALFVSVINNPSPPPALLPGPVAVQVGQPASGISGSLIVQSIELQVIGGAGTSYSGVWLVKFDPAMTVRSVRPVSVATILTVDKTTPTATKITGCQTPSGPANTPQLHMQVFTASGTFTTPPETTTSTQYKFTLAGGGGGGGGCTIDMGYGGGAGGYSVYLGTGVSAGTGIPVVVGSAGAGGASGGGNGAAGTATSIVFNGTTVTANGGGGGGGNWGFGAGAAGGTATNGTINIQGGRGFAAASMYAGTPMQKNTMGGPGGLNPLGAGGNSSYNQLSTGWGGAATGYGSGGGGGSCGNWAPSGGGNGAPGIVIVEWIQ